MKYDGSAYRMPGRPPIDSVKRTGAGVICGFRVHWPTLDIASTRTTIANILKRHGIAPAPERIKQTTWREFLKRHWDQIIATDFFTVEVWTCSGLTRFVVLFFMDVSTRKVQIGGIANKPDGLWMGQIARNLTDAVDGLFLGKRYLIHDRDPLYTQEFLTHAR
jgi:hypothetical protein